MKTMFCSWVCFLSILSAFGAKDTVSYEVNMKRAAEHYFEIKMQFNPESAKDLNVKMPIWSPGYYQVMDYGENLSGLKVENSKGEPLNWQKTGTNTWHIENKSTLPIIIYYSIKANRSFVANSFIDTSRAFIKPANTFLYIDGQLARPIKLLVFPNENWNTIATALEALPGVFPETFIANDYDELFDSPMLLGDLDQLPVFSVGNVPHRFIGYQLGDFDYQSFVNDLQSIIQQAVNVFGHIPFKEYTFIGIGPGQGGIEQSNSTSISFDGQSLNGKGRTATLSFLAHEYFHHYNVKRIRPIELGPFDYGKPGKTSQLWVSEGLTVYYEGIILNRAGLLSAEELLANWTQKIQSYENNPGRFHQSLTQSSLETWEDGPFGNRESGKTISFYEKGPIIGLLLDLTIRNRTQNRHSLDDVMRFLYQEYYLKKERGFTSDEFKQACEHISGAPLDEVLDYVDSVSSIDYEPFFKFAGLDIRIKKSLVGNSQVRKVEITRSQHPAPLQLEIFNSLFLK